MHGPAQRGACGVKHELGLNKCVFQRACVTSSVSSQCNSF